MYTWTIPAFGATPVVATAKERDRVIAENKQRTDKYERELATWNKAKAEYDRRLAAYAAESQAIEIEYSRAMTDYQARLRAAQAAAAGIAQGNASAAAAYNAAKLRRDNQISANLAVASRVIGSNPYPPGFVQAGYCATAEQVATWRNYCAPVRGLGANEPYCVWQNLPVCTVPPLPPAPVPQAAPAMPIAPVKRTLGAAPKAPGPQPPPPKLLAVPTVVAPPPPIAEPPPRREPPPIPELPPPRPSEEPAPRQGMAVFGILALVVVAGGGAYWYTHRKKKQAA